MTISANAGPLVIFGQAAVPPGSGLGVAQDYNSHAGPSLFFSGNGILDPRYPFSYQPGNPNTKAYGWLGVTGVPILDTVPATKAVGAIAAAANVVAATPMTLVSTSGAGILVGQSVTNAATGANVTGLLAIGTAGGAVPFPTTGWTFTVTSANATVGATYTNNGVTFTVLSTIASGTTLTTSVSAGGSPTNAASNTLTKVTGTGDSTITFSASVPTGSGNNIWDPTKMLARVVAITAAAAASGTVVFTIKGYDVYGYPMSEAITAAANTQTLGKKAWKYIASVTPATTDAQNYSIDTTDTIGFSLRADFFSYLAMFYGSPATPANNAITAATGFVTADTTTPATTTTGDVRGTYALQSASDGTKRLTIFITPSVANIGSIVGLTGVAQV